MYIEWFEEELSYFIEESDIYPNNVVIDLNVYENLIKEIQYVEYQSCGKVIPLSFQGVKLRKGECKENFYFYYELNEFPIEDVEQYVEESFEFQRFKLKRLFHKLFMTISETIGITKFLDKMVRMINSKLIK